MAIFLKIGPKYNFFFFIVVAVYSFRFWVKSKFRTTDLHIRDICGFGTLNWDRSTPSKLQTHL